LTIIAKYFQIHYKNLSSYASLKDVEYCRIERVKKFMESNTLAETFELNTEDLIKLQLKMEKEPLQVMELFRLKLELELDEVQMIDLLSKRIALHI